MDRSPLLIAVDTNLLIYAHRATLPEHRLARAVLDHLAGSEAGWGISQPSVAEFWSIVTHPTAAVPPSSPTQARAFLTKLLTDGLGQLWIPGPGFAERLFGAATQLKVNGPHIFDLQIAVIALEHGATELWTHDRNFVSVPGLPVHDPLPRRRNG
ncbi:MAG: VapC toxin family PIN domain ribonuclease [Candidatus Rokuibacteriota bacterium]|nr:MAG: VapC toxin family PIN domain ribonuclease [Candidatus Rokubacteria bacterium]